MKKSYLNITHELLSAKLCNHQAINLIEFKIYKYLPPKPKKKPSQNVYGIFFKNKGVQFINIAFISRDPNIVKSLPSSSVKFPIPVVTYKLAPPTLCFSISISFSTI